MLVLNVLLAIVFYFLIAVFNRFQSVKTAIMTFVFLTFFNLYGWAYKHLMDVDLIRLEHYTFLPFVLMMAIYLMLFVNTLNISAALNIWKQLVLMVSVLVLFNVANIVPAEIERREISRAVVPADLQSQLSIKERSPDIYYIVLDEFAGFQAMREYWHYEEVDDFVHFLKDRDFFVAEASHGSTKSTLHELASRLNYRDYPSETSHQAYFNEIADNRVMRYLKSRGYTTVVFDETKLALPSAKQIQADYIYEYGDTSIPESQVRTDGLQLDEFGELVMGNTMFYLIPEQYYRYHAVIHPHNNIIRFSLEHASDKSIPSPKFVYVHLLLPHPPFMFTRTGEIVEGHFTDWNYYLDNYIFSITITQKMIDNILKAYDATNPPVIILQSDHGGRNESNVESIFLENYAEEYKTLILYALYLPGYDYSSLPQDIKPVNTFPIVFNYLFDADIPLIK